jgi:hypothetical protein
MDNIFSNQFTLHLLFLLKLSSLLANVWDEEAVQTFFLSIRLDIHYLIEILRILIHPKDYDKPKKTGVFMLH